MVAGCALATSASSQSLTAGEIDAAIQAAHDGREKQLILSCRALPGFGEYFKEKEDAARSTYSGSFDIVAASTAGHIALLAAAAKRLYKPFTAKDVPDDLKTTGVIVTAEPENPQTLKSGAMNFASPIEQIVIKASPKGERFVLPTSLKTEPIEWSGPGGRIIKGNRARARFAAGDIRELPPGGLDIAVVTTAGERRCGIRSGDRARVFGR